jgi:hypothetical protein
MFFNVNKSVLVIVNAQYRCVSNAYLYRENAVKNGKKEIKMGFDVRYVISEERIYATCFNASCIACNISHLQLQVCILQ